MTRLANSPNGGYMHKKVALLTLIIVASALIVGRAARRAEENHQNENPVIRFDELTFYSPPAQTTFYPEPAADTVRNVIVCIGDGMGHSQIAMARIAAAGPAGRLHMERIPQACTVTTHCADSEITCSAASATALATGIKTNKGMIGMDPQGKKYQTILHAAAQTGMMTGIVVSSSVTHATPAGFYAHVEDRSYARQIAAQLLDAKVNVAFGGGRRYFLPMKKRLLRHTDQTDLISSAVADGYAYIHDAAGLQTARGPHVLGLFADQHLDADSPGPWLAELTEKAIELLDTSANGFFLMIEGSHIDWTCHENNAHECIRQTLLFDLAVKVAIDFAIRDGRTLVLVTADHETGGLVVKGWDRHTRHFQLDWTTTGHTAAPVPLFAFGPAAQNFRGELDNTDVPRIIASLLGINEFPRPAE